MENWTKNGGKLKFLGVVITSDILTYNRGGAGCFLRGCVWCIIDYQCVIVYIIAII